MTPKAHTIYLMATAVASTSNFGSVIPEPEKPWYPPKTKRRKRKGWMKKGKKQ